jgi:hypothetical protein
VEHRVGAGHRGIQRHRVEYVRVAVLGPGIEPASANIQDRDVVAVTYQVIDHV